MACYSLPYGALGFTSHLLTYYTVAVLSAGRSPFRPWKKLTHSSFDLYLSSIGLVGGFALALFTLVRCRNHWQLLLVGIWKLSMSVFNGVVGVHTAIIMRRAKKKAERQQNQNLTSRTYLPLSGKDDDDWASFRKSVHSGDPEKGKESGPSPKTVRVWGWAFLCE